MKTVKYERFEKLYYQSKQSYESLYQHTIDNKNTTYVLPVKENGFPFFVVSSKELLELVQNIYIKNNKLTRIYNSLPPLAIRQYINSSMIDEVMQSNDIEGVYSTRKQLRFVMNKKRNTRIKFSGLMHKYMMVTNDAQIPLQTSQDIRNLYDDILLHEVEKADKPDGKVFRNSEVNVIGGNEKPIHTGITPEPALVLFMNRSLEWLNNDSVPSLIRVAGFHHLFAYAHPFYDGNGRMARFISSYLMKETLNYLVSFKLSYTINEQKSQYYKAFTETENRYNRGDLTYFCIVFLNMILDAIEMLIADLSESQSKLRFYENVIKLTSYFEPGVESDVMNILVQNTLFGDESISVKEMESSIDYSHVWIRKSANTLCEKGFALKEKRSNTWYYSAVLDKLIPEG